MRDAAVAKIDALIEKMHEESAGLLVKALNLGIDLLIAPFRFALGLFGYDMSAIDDVIRRVKRTFTFIISYPLEFAKRMIRGVDDGFSQFGKNIKSHLINTLVGWLTGALMDQPVVIPEKWNVSGILQFIGSLVGIGSEMVMGLIRNLLPEEVIEQAENLLPVFMRIPEEGPGALWEYIRDEAQSMKETAIAGVRDAVITQLVIIGIQKLMNVLTLGGSAFADAAKAIYDMILFFKNNWRKIVDLVTKIFNTLSAVADNDTKMVADGIENTMGRGLEIVFGFFMTSFGLGGVVNSVINVFRKIGDILRKAVTKAVDLVVGAVKRTFKGMFKGRGGNEEGEGAEQEDTANPNAQGSVYSNRLLSYRSTFKEKGGTGPKHTLKFIRHGGGIKLMVFSNGREIRDYLNDKEKIVIPEGDDEKKALKKEGLRIEEEVSRAVKRPVEKQVEFDRLTSKYNRLHEIMTGLSGKFPQLPVPKYDFKIDGEGKAIRSRVDLVSSRTGTGTSPGDAWVKGWDHIMKGLTTGGGKWVRLHMINEKRFGGPGASGNLVPGPHQANQDHKNKWEIPADDALGPVDTEYNPEKHKVAWLEARISYYSGGHFDSKYSPPLINGEPPMRHWFASEINFYSGLYKEKTGGGGWEKDGSKTLVPDFTLTGHELPLPNWTLAKVPPINTGDRSEFQERAVALEVLSASVAKAAFDKGGGWKHLAKRREQSPFTSSQEVIGFLTEVAREKRPRAILEMIQALRSMFASNRIRID